MADSNFCTVCVRSAEQNTPLDPESHTNTFYAELFDVSEASVRRHYKHGSEPRLGQRDVTMQTKTPTSEKPEVTEFSSTGARSVSDFKAIRTRAVTAEDVRAWLRSTGDDPDQWNYSMRSIAYGDGLFSNKMSAWPKAGKRGELPADLPDIDPIAILTAVRDRGEFSEGGGEGGEGAFVMSLNDTQFGKDEGGGTPATLARIKKYVGLAIERINELRDAGRELGTFVLIGGGDIVEGCAIYPNQSYNLDLDRRGQINTSVATILYILDEIAPYFDEIIVLATRGNHGENRINGNRTTLYDNDDTLVFEMAKLATDRDDDLAHVRYVIAESEAGVYVDVAGWRLATTHGDIYGKGVAGATQDKKAQAWYKNMAMARNPLGAADVLITHHFHHDKMSDWGACLWRQTPALDGGSAWFEQTSGEYSLAGMLTFVMTPETRYDDEKVLR